MSTTYVVFTFTSKVQSVLKKKIIYTYIYLVTFFIVLLSIGGFLSTLTHGPVNHKNYCGGGRNHSTGYWTFTTYLLLKVCEFVSLWVANMVLYRKSCIRYNHKKRFAGLKKKWCSGACYCYYLPYYSSDLKVILSISLPTIALLYYFSFGFLNSLTIIFDIYITFWPLCFVWNLLYCPFI